MTETSKALRGYYREIRSWLPCSRRQKNEIIARLRENIREYLGQHSDADVAQVCAHFGSPKTIAMAYIDELGTGTLLQELRIRRKIVSVIAGVMASILAIWLVTVSWAVVKELNRDEGIFQENGITVIE